MAVVFDLKSKVLAIGDPTMGLARYSHSLPPGTYRLGAKSLTPVGSQQVATDHFIDLDNPCVFALDAALLADFEAWYHQVGNECSYNMHSIAERLGEFERTVAARLGFYWAQEVAVKCREGQYVLDPERIVRVDAD